jgi:hypothetical protein
LVRSREVDRDAHGCWTGARRTSENAVKAKFVRNVYYDVGLIRASRKAEADF